MRPLSAASDNDYQDQEKAQAIKNSTRDFYERLWRRRTGPWRIPAPSASNRHK
jgi:hypothetical protein